MSTKKRRAKRHDPNKRAKAFFNQSFRVWIWEADRAENGDQIAYAKKHMGTFWRDVGLRIVQPVLSRPQNWSVCIRALCASGNGDPWIEEVTVTVKNTPLQDLESVYMRYRDEVLQACQIRHVYDCGWLAQTFGARNPADTDRWAMIEMGEISEARKAIWNSVQESVVADREAA